MRKIQKTIFVAYNGAEFDSQGACVAHERHCAWTEHIYKNLGRNPDVDEVWEYIKRHCQPPYYPKGFVEPEHKDESDAS